MREKDWVWKYYYTDKSYYRQDKTHKKAWCQAELDLKISRLRQDDQATQYNEEHTPMRDEATLIKDAAKPEDALCGKLDLLIKHLLECDHVSPEIKTKAQEHQKQREELKAASRTIITRGPAGSRSVAAHRQSIGSDGQPAIRSGPLSTSEQESFDRDICDLFVACGFAWFELENPIFKDFCRKWIPGTSVPHRQAISHRVLPERVAEVEAEAKLSTRGKLAMGQCDGWKNIAHSPVVGMLMTVQAKAYILNVHNVGASKKSAENLLALIKENMEEGCREYGVEWVGWCTDAGGDSRKARKLLFDDLPQLINPDCAAHQVNLFVGDYFKIKMDFISAGSKAQAVIKWFNNHTRALAWLQDEQKHSFQKVLALIYPVLTRWTSVYMALKRLLECLPAFRGLLNNRNRMELRDVAGTERRAREKALEILDIIEDEQFWSNVTRIVSHLEPLTIAAHITEGASTRLDHVLLTFASLYRIYSRMQNEDATVGGELCGSLERRWTTVDQDPFIFAVFANPYVRADLFNKQSESGEFLCTGMLTLAIRLWKRLFNQSGDPDSQFVKALSDYYTRNISSIFSDAHMNLAMLERVAHAEGREVDILEVWQQLDDHSFRGRNWLVKLAVRVLSVVANSAGCERLFSQMGRIHTKYRSRLDLQCVRNTVVLKNALMRPHNDAQEQTNRLKRKVREFDLEENPDNVLRAMDEIGEAPAVDENLENEADAAAVDPTELFAQLAQRLIDEAIEDGFAAAEFDEHTLQDRANEFLARAITFGRPTRTPLSHIFDFSACINPPAENTQLSGATVPEGERIRSKGIDMYWRSGVKDLRKAMDMLADFQGGSSSCET
ncbi:hypothetical protein FRC09_004049 [Ceratobasidium sp. 395]|nr:hypothetical protein FRC09_004049 [Ceratobasidium sp. 395]